MFICLSASIIIAILCEKFFYKRFNKNISKIESIHVASWLLFSGVGLLSFLPTKKLISIMLDFDKQLPEIYLYCVFLAYILICSSFLMGLITCLTALFNRENFPTFKGATNTEILFVIFLYVIAIYGQIVLAFSSFR